MDNATRIRLGSLLLALAATVVAIVYPVEDSVSEASSEALAVKPAAPRTVPKPDEQQNRGLWTASDENPFAPRVWQVAPSAAAVHATAPQPQPVQAQEPPPVPLPYRFLGQMQDGGKRVLYLGRGEQVVLAHQGDVLENSYKVVSVGETQIEFESVQSGLRQTLPIPAQ